MEQETPNEEKIPKWVKRILEKRDALIKEHGEDLNNIESDGIVTKKEARRISRRSRDIQNFDTRLQRSGFIPPQTSLPTSQTKQIALPQGTSFEQSTGFNISPRRIGGEGGGAGIRPFQLSVVNDAGWKVRVYPSTLAGGSSLDLGFSLGDDPPFLLNAEDGIVEGKITIDEEGNVVERSLQLVSNLSLNTTTDFHVEIGTVRRLLNNTFIVANSRYGPIDAQICRNWFSNPPTYGVTFISEISNIL